MIETKGGDEAIVWSGFRYVPDSKWDGGRLEATRGYEPEDVVFRVWDHPIRLGGNCTRTSICLRRGVHIESDPLWRLNHSCDPTAYFAAEALEVRAARAVMPGEQLTFFYPSFQWQSCTPFECRCGSPRCIGIYAGARHLAPDVLARYHLSASVREELARLSTAERPAWRA